jgi:hypothetical protein
MLGESSKDVPGSGYSGRSFSVFVLKPTLEI